MYGGRGEPMIDKGKTGGLREMLGSGCERTALRLVKFRGNKPFNLVWYCAADAKIILRQNRSARIIHRLKPTMTGYLVSIGEKGA